ncbi:Alpha-1,3-mannosyl-glycoprotein 2-beta-N-acetylglucosaminyltransferase [Glycine soja]|uniref:Alpha-1,3-mannosyl-glycoprotein 2-beta-N-acetylglucosaminyltransferase n=1 Tax=Glycine soja TaxID=3848 RepID=A0A445KTT2_GLYSO|nr:Alpha-1,3-mannosyl-glycoprotein 2-beta-N-acetylglucosaminyltransferase [Glycine soja]
MAPPWPPFNNTDDMEIAPDFFDYFEAAASLLEKDKSIMAVSSWNDNGQKQFVHDPLPIHSLHAPTASETATPPLVNDRVEPQTRDELYRSDFFPGLGWMLARSTWNELSPKWPKAYP